MPPAVIGAVDLRKAHALAVDGITFALAAGDRSRFLGANGAGTTTTMRMRCGRIRRDGGQLQVLGLDPGRAAAGVRARTGIVARARTLDREPTMAETLAVRAASFGIGGRPCGRGSSPSWR